MAEYEQNTMIAGAGNSYTHPAYGTFHAGDPRSNQWLKGIMSEDEWEKLRREVAEYRSGMAGVGLGTDEEGKRIQPKRPTLAPAGWSELEREDRELGDAILGWLLGASPGGYKFNPGAIAGGGVVINP